jgi:hypothetical protein
MNENTRTEYTNSVLMMKFGFSDKIKHRGVTVGIPASYSESICSNLNRETSKQENYPLTSSGHPDKSCYINLKTGHDNFVTHLPNSLPTFPQN